MSSFKYYDERIDRVPVWSEGEVIPISTAAKIAKCALDQTKHVVVSKSMKSTMRLVGVDSSKVDSLLRSLLNQRAMRAMVDDEVDRIVIGRDLWHGVIDHYCERAVCFNYEVLLGAPGRPPQMYGAPVQVLPNIEGYLILPKMNVRW